ncbi:MAG: hypothetical protein LLF94_06380 [Chlamydiales bacterium]|nr:hypothetical protein [Chlamydiales bacterium]
MKNVLKKLGITCFVVIMISFLFMAGCKEHSKNVCDADFDMAMGKNGQEWHNLCSHKGSFERFTMLKNTYEDIKPSKIVAANEPKIPKIIHQIWLGPKPIPHYYWGYRDSWKKCNPDWEYVFWTDKEVEEFDFELKDLYNRTPNWGEKSDILRAELLDRFGGLYVDTDFECLKGFSELNLKYDFYAGLESPHDGDSSSSAPHITISDALIGSTPNHPIIKKWKKLIRSRWDEYEQKYPDGLKRVLSRTFYPFGRAVLSKMHDKERTNIVFPATYFFPLTFTEISKGRMKKMSFFRRQARQILTALNLRDPQPFVEIQPETMAIHYWGHSWVKSNDERFRDMHKQIVEMQKDFKNEIVILQNEVDSLRGKLARSQ